MRQDRLTQALNFVAELDRLKKIQRQTLLHDSSRRENSAEHSWHLAMSVIVLAGAADEKIDVGRAVEMALVHDIVEIDAGDTFIYDAIGNEDKAAREAKAARRLFGLLEPKTGDRLKKLWEAFEAQACPESRFVASLDRLLPLMSNRRTRGHTWRLHNIQAPQVFARNRVIEKGSKQLWAYTRSMLEDCRERGFLNGEFPKD
jgi:putative hydrolase of HD superfamily